MDQDAVIRLRRVVLRLARQLHAASTGAITSRAAPVAIFHSVLARCS